MTPNFITIFKLLILTLFTLLIVICLRAYIKVKHCPESTSMVDAICSMFHDYYCKYSPFVLPLFVGARVEVNEQLEFIVGPIDGGFKSIKMDVGVDPRIEFQVNGVARLLIPSMKLC